ncbi:TIGR02391 family protein [Bradyrhizobium niftali]|uniref:TIGR02391 family protein n=1 Tax=Bradyrhizobium niftali TaxID=2560055 RepID=UPI003D31C9D6
MHLKTREDVWALYHRGKLDTEVLEAMKAVEVRAGRSGPANKKDIGTTLMRKAFDPVSGPLTDMSTALRELTDRAPWRGVAEFRSPRSPAWAGSVSWRLPGS